MSEIKKTEKELQQELLEAKAQLADLKPNPEPKKKPYTKDEIAEHEKKGHIIGNPNQKLSSGHNEEDLQRWDMWLISMELKTQHIPEIGKEWSIPTSITILKKEKAGKVANDKTFQWENNAINFRERGANKQLFFNFPKGTVEAGKTYDCTYWAKKTGRGDNEKELILVLVKDFPRATGAHEKK